MSVTLCRLKFLLLYIRLTNEVWNSSSPELYQSLLVDTTIDFHSPKSLEKPFTQVLDLPLLMYV